LLDITGQPLIGKPSSWMVKYVPLIRNQGRVLDLACGNGRHAIWLAQQGYQVDAIDRDEQAMSKMSAIQNINIRVVELETGNWPDSGMQYDGIIVSRYLYRPLLPVLAEMLNDGSVLIYETFMAGNERYGKPSNPDYLLKQDELLNVYSPLLDIMAFEQGEEDSPRPSVMQRICAVKIAS